MVVEPQRQYEMLGIGNVMGVDSTIDGHYLEALNCSSLAQTARHRSATPARAGHPQ